MHMPNELLSVPVAGACFAVSAGGVGFACKAAEKNLSQEKIPLMGILGAFIFAAQMVNFPLPFGASGHLTGAVFLAIVLGPAAAAVVMTSVVIVQCLIFQDGGLLALGANIINLALLPSFLGHFIYRLIAPDRNAKVRVYSAAVAASCLSLIAAAALLSVETALSGTLVVPFGTFLAAMCGIHLLIGIVEGIITAALLVYLVKARPDIFDGTPGTAAVNKKQFFVTASLAVFITAACLSLLASEKPDGLEYSIAGGSSQKSVIKNESPAVETAGRLHEKIAPMPDYTRKSTDGKEHHISWTSVAGVTGSAVTMLGVWAAAQLLRRRGVL